MLDIKRDQQFKKEQYLIHKNIQYKKFQILGVAGQGTFGVVFKIIHEDEMKALKITLQQKKHRNREADIISKINHYNIISVIDKFFVYNSDQQYLNILMDYFPSNLHEICRTHYKNKTKFNHRQIKIISFQLFKALAYLQDINICHRDLKPQNILINYNTLQVKICDFGSAKVIKENEKNVVYICSRYYRAPELIFGQVNYLHEVDMWSLGCVLAQMLYLDPIFPGSNNVQQLIEIFKLLGTPKQSDGYDNKNHHIVSSIKPIKWQSIFHFYKPEPGFVDLISRILIFNREKRLKAAEALVHPYFQQLWNSPPLALPSILNFSQNKFIKYPEQKRVIQNIFKEKQFLQETICCTPQLSLEQIGSTFASQ